MTSNFVDLVCTAKDENLGNFRSNNRDKLILDVVLSLFDFGVELHYLFSSNYSKTIQIW